MSLLVLAAQKDQEKLFVEADLLHRIVLAEYEIAPDRHHIPSQENRDWKLYSEMTQEVPPEELYQKFKESYDASTGSSWDEEEFSWKSRGWIYFGDRKGFVALRPQNSGMWKLVGVAGSPISIYKAFQKINQIPYPIWGGVSSEIKDMIVRASNGNFVPAPPEIIKLLHKHIPLGNDLRINSIAKDGAMQATYKETMNIVKYYVANRAYWEKIADDFVQSEDERLRLVPQFVRKMLVNIGKRKLR